MSTMSPHARDRMYGSFAFNIMNGFRQRLLYNVGGIWCRGRNGPFTQMTNKSVKEFLLRFESRLAALIFKRIKVASGPEIGIGEFEGAYVKRAIESVGNRLHPLNCDFSEFIDNELSALIASGGIRSFR